MDISNSGLPAGLPGFDDPIGLLRACHSKMQLHCELLDWLVSRASIDSEARRAARNITRYFTQSAPLHHRDEEEDLFPHINRQSPEITELIHSLNEEHEILETHWKAIAPELEQLPDEGLSENFKRKAGKFTTLYQQHITRENTELLPLASNSLSPKALMDIGQSMANRRGVNIAADHD